MKKEAVKGFRNILARVLFTFGVVDLFHIVQDQVISDNANQDGMNHPEHL